jgi:hypothetical protein
LADRLDGRAGRRDAGKILAPSICSAAMVIWRTTDRAALMRWAIMRIQGDANGMMKLDRAHVLKRSADAE